MTQDPKKQNDIADWERGLENLRQRRHQPQQHSERPTVAVSKPQARSAPVTPKPQPKLDAKAREKVLLDYLKQWQDEHNGQLQESEIETDANVLLQDDWLRAQSALQFSVDASKVDTTKTVWLKRKATPEETIHAAQEQGVGVDNEVEIEIEAQQVPINVQVLAPEVVRTNAPVMCITESDLYERISKRLRPHLTDAVNGMVKVAVQRQVASLTHQLQQSLHAETPVLVDEILQYNLKMVMSEIKYELKYKKR
ncbi:MAG: hypothetical protein WBO82_07385 [Neisseria sp.]